MNNRQTVQAAHGTEVVSYRPQLDGLRAIAVLLVVLHHYHVKLVDGQAILGVNLFFVLSGFLITTILLRSRELAISSGQLPITSLGQFYIRRFLRIFPLYYFLVFLGVTLRLGSALENLPWLLTYTLNFHMAHQGWYIADYAHFWSLAVEEQYYLVWPWLVLFVPKRWLPSIAAAMIIIGPIYRWLGVIHNERWIATYVSTIANLDTIGMGSLMAILLFPRSVNIGLSLQVSRLWLLIGVLSSMAVWSLRAHYGATLYTVLFGPTTAFLSCWLIHRASTGFGGITKTVLESKPLLYTGKISYGLYVYHPFMPTVCAAVATLFGCNYSVDTPVGFLFAVVTSFVASSISWYLFEKPINDLKRYFQPRVRTTDIITA